MSDFSLKPISEINVNDTIIDAYGNSQIVEHVHCREAVDGEIVSVKHRGNGDALISTIDHKFLPFSWNGELLNSEGVAISDLGLDSYLSEIIPKCPLESASIDLYKLSLAHLPYVKLIGNKVKHYCGNLVTQYIPLDNKLGRLCGYYLSEGSVTNGCVSFGLHGQTEIVYANEICMLLKDIFGLDSKWEVDGNQGKVICNSTVLALFFSKFFGTKEEKHVGLKPNRAFLEGIMYGVCRGDATFNNDQARCTLMMSRPNLIRDLYVVSLMLGFCPSLSKTGIRSDGRIYKSVNFNAADYNTIAKLANVPYVEWQPSKFSKVDRKLVDNHLISKITEIKQLNYKGLVYDLQVGGSHTYIANFVCVHNCQYCGTRPGSEELTLDHIMPRSRGGKTTWENVVCACVSCNSKKADRTPAEAGMKLRTKPVKPTLSICRRQAIKCESWKHFISEVYWATTLDNDMNE
jgi:5-methylcytosine-specific restriction endonuclease McrA